MVLRDPNAIEKRGRVETVETPGIYLAVWAEFPQHSTTFLEGVPHGPTKITMEKHVNDGGCLF